MKTRNAPLSLWSDMLTRPDGEDTFFYIEGCVTLFSHTQRAKKLFGLRGYNVRRRINIDKNSFFSASREVIFYTDSHSQAILDRWENPITTEISAVAPVQNDRVNRRYERKTDGIYDVTLDGSKTIAKVEPAISLDDRWLFQCDIFPFYELTDGIKYSAAELFNFHVSEKACIPYDPYNLTVVADWTRVGPFLPWMNDMSGYDFLIYHCFSERRSLAAIPADIRARVTNRYPEFLHAPETVEIMKDSQTSWKK